MKVASEDIPVDDVGDPVEMTKEETKEVKTEEKEFPQDSVDDEVAEADQSPRETASKRPQTTDYR